MIGTMRAMALALGTLAAGAAGAATLDEVTVDAGGPSVSIPFDVSFEIAGGEVTNVFGGTVVNLPSGPTLGTLVAETGASGLLGVGLGALIPPSGFVTALDGTLEDQEVTSGGARLLLSNDAGGALTGDFGPFLLVTLTPSGTSPILPADGIYAAGALIESASAAVIPLPAGGWLLVLGIGALGAARMRQSGR